MYRARQLTFGSALVRAAILVALVATTLISVPFQTVEAQGENIDTLEVWGLSSGVVDDPKQWKFTQSTSAANDIGSATAASLGYDDSGWQDVTLRWKEFPGSNVANHFRKDFTLEDIGVELFEIDAIRVSLQYDDTAVMYLNGVEVYRSVRGNLDPNFDPYGVSDDMPFDINVAYGGFEERYINIPDPAGVNDCERFPGCTQSPYPGLSNPPEIPKELLRDGVNTWAVTTWNQSGGGSGDSSLNHTFSLMIDPNAVPPNTVFINEVMASNDTAYEVQLDDDPQLETPDWFELVNTSNNPVNLAGWTVSDNSASWVFPDVSIAGNGYMIVVANDDDRTDTDPLRTNFKLSKEGDTLRLTNADGFVADDYVTLPQQFDDNSYGRPNDSGTPTYLAAATPGQPNSGAGDGYAPILRPFANRIYNVGESVSHQVVAFDPDGDSLEYSLSPMPPGLSISGDGLITGTVTTVGSFPTTLTVADGDNDTDSQPVTWDVLPAAQGPAPIVLNEYNAVPQDREFLAGGLVGNGGDWFEFVVVEDELDLRGYIFEFWDQKGPDDQTRNSAIVTIADDVRFRRAPSGTIITFSQDQPDDFDFDAVNDWHINFQIDATANGAFVDAPFVRPPWTTPVFNSTRSQQMVLIRNAAGDIVTPLSGETEAWDNANGGVSGSEVMSLCIDVTRGLVLDPVASYRDNGASTSFGQPNTCEFVDINGVVTTFDQSLNDVRSTSTLGAGSGDTNCDMRLTVNDALSAAQYSVGNRDDSGYCFFDRGGAGFDMSAAAADITQNGRVSVQDAIVISQCSVGIPTNWCEQ